MPLTLHQAACGAFAAVSLALGATHWATTPELDWAFEVSSPAVDAGPEPHFETVLDYHSEAGTAHAAAIRSFPDGAAIIWFDGSGEAKRNVEIWQSRITLRDGAWAAGEAETFLRKSDLRPATVPRQEIMTLGNTIQLGRESDRVLSTIVSIGGWAAASIADVQLEDGRVTKVRKLPLSPVLNRSYLVRSPTVTYGDGSIGLPAYFEMDNAFGELVRLDRLGRVRDKRRITQGRLGIQPTIVPFDELNAVALLRNFDRDSDRLVASWTEDGGQSWSKAELLELPNPDAPVAVVRMRNGNLLMAFNNSPDDATILNLAVSDDGGRNWRQIATLEQAGGNVRYPAMTYLPNGQILLTYSYGGKKGIRAHVFNEAWVEAQ